MIIACIISIIVALCAIAVAIIAVLSRHQVNKKTAIENDKLIELNQALHQTRESYQKQIKQLQQSQKEIFETYEQNIIQNKNIQQEINELTQYKININTEIQFSKEQKAALEAELKMLQQHATEISDNQKAIAQASFEQYCEMLD